MGQRFLHNRESKVKNNGQEEDDHTNGLALATKMY